MESLIEERVRELEIAEGITDSLSNLLSSEDDSITMEVEGETPGANTPVKDDNFAAEEAKEEDEEDNEEEGEGKGERKDSDSDWEKVPGTDWVDLLGSGQLLKKASKTSKRASEQAMPHRFIISQRA
jgi:hypothetical protein